MLFRSWGVQPDDLVIGTVSRLDPVKGLEYLLEAVAIARKSEAQVRVVLVGDGGLRDALEAQVLKLGLKDVVSFAGYRDDIPDCLAAFDIFALPSLAEYHSIGLLEAMRAGLAIIATDVGGNTES